MYSTLLCQSSLHSWFIVRRLFGNNNNKKNLAFFTSIQPFSIFCLDRGFHHEHQIKLKFLVPFLKQGNPFFSSSPNLHPVPICRRFVYVMCVCVCVSFGIQQPTSSGIRKPSLAVHKTRNRHRCTSQFAKKKPKKTKLNASSYAIFHFSKCWPSHNENMKLHYTFPSTRRRHVSEGKSGRSLFFVLLLACD